MYKIICPETDLQWHDYFTVRYLTLRQQWGQPLGSEHCDDDAVATHAMVVDEMGKGIAVCRLHFNNATNAQIRMMGVLPEYQGKKLGSMLLSYLEKIATEKGATIMELDAREEAVPFYTANGYKVVRESKVLWGLIPHFWMEKYLP